MEQPSYLLAQPFQLAAPETWDVVDDTSSRTITVPGGASHAYRILLGSTSVHTPATPGDLLHVLEQLLGSLWTVRLGADGRVAIAYSGASPGSLTPPGGSAVAQLLGGHDFGTTWAPDESRPAPSLPTHCIFAGVCDPDTGWRLAAGRFAGSVMPDGTVYGWSDRLASRTRAVTLRWLPKDALARESILVGEAGTAPGTPAYGPLDRWLDAWSAEPAQPPPWGAMETVATCGAQALGWTDDLQRLVAGTAVAFDVVYLTPTSLKEARAVLSVEHFDARRDVTGLELSYAGEGSRS